MLYVAAIIFFSVVSLSTAVRILSLGDSITCGCGSTSNPSNFWTAVCPRGVNIGVGGYRAPLYANLLAANVSDVSFVGTQQDGPSWVPANQQFHEGWPGYTIKQIESRLPKWAATNPDIILCLLGTNDIAQNHSIAEMTADMASLLSLTFAALPKVHIFVGSILQMVSNVEPSWEASVTAYNEALPAIVANAGTGGGGSATFVDLFTASGGLCNSNTSSIRRMCTQGNSGNPPPVHPPLYERVHPTAAGYSSMAGVWAAALFEVVF